MSNIIQKQAFAYFLVCALSVLSHGQNKSAGNQSGYVGPVESVRTESVDFFLDKGRLRRGERKVDSTTRFDPRGRILETRSLKDDGSILWGEKHLYDSQGRLKETLLEHARFVYLPDRQTYKYDAKGNLIEELGYDAGGKLVNVSEYVYDEKNRRIQWTSMSHHAEENSKPHRWTYSYDEKGKGTEVRAFSDEGDGFKPTDTLGGPHRRLSVGKDGGEPLTILLFKADGTFAGMTMTLYDRKGEVVKEVEHDEDGSVKSRRRYAYRYDRYGNLTRQSIYRWIGDGKGGRFQISEVRYYIIKYRR